MVIFKCIMIHQFLVPIYQMLMILTVSLGDMSLKDTPWEGSEGSEGVVLATAYKTKNYKWYSLFAVEETVSNWTW